MSTGLQRATARHGKSRHADKLAQFQSTVDAVNENNSRVVADLLSLSGESLTSLTENLGDFARDTLSSLFGGATTPAVDQPQAPSSQPVAAQPKLDQASMGMGGRLLGRGMVGPEVKTLQNRLNSLGYELELDGKFGPKTEAALRDFQGQQRVDGKAISVDGILGPETSRALANSAEEQTTEEPNGAADGAHAQNAAVARDGELNGAGDSAAAQNAAADKAGAQNGAGDGAAAQNAAADKAGAQNGAGDGAAAQNAAADNDSGGKGKN